MSSSAALPSAVSARLDLVRAAMRDAGVDVLVVRATDGYLNEYVPDDQSTRRWLTGFTGSMGDAVVTADALHLVVDGRYTLQASQEVPGAIVKTTITGQSIEQAWLELLASIAAGKVVGVESRRTSLALMRSAGTSATAAGWTLKALPNSPVDVVRASSDPPPAPGGTLWAIDPALSGHTVSERIDAGRSVLQQHSLTAFLVCALDELAWLVNLRGDQFDYQATFRASGLVTESAVVLQADQSAFVGKRAAEAAIAFVDEAGFAKSIAAGARVGVDPSTTPHAVAQSLIDAGAVLVEVSSPWALMRTKKTAAELAHMQAAFARADVVIESVQKWVAQQLKKNKPLTEADIAAETERRFRESGAFALSFKVIAAAGENGAVIHYSNPSTTRIVKSGELFLLDTGAYYEGGYATDLTRTFLAGPQQQKATKEQKRLYTLVLKAAIAGMSARVPVGFTGEQLDALVRDPLWRAGLDYGHGTGHGVGVNVHESPPSVRIGGRGTVEPGQVFSIEPGVYLPGWGGVRTENLCTVVEDTIVPPVGVPRRFLRVKPLTFSPFDVRLIERSLLTEYEKRFLAWFKRKNRTPLPPLV
jgi:Xaa-Pro aminopeptidase